jgi:hypothetical protein
LLQPDPRNPNRLQRFACSCFSPSKTNPATSYLGLFVVSVSILKGVIVKSELLVRWRLLWSGSRTAILTCS